MDAKGFEQILRRLSRRTPFRPFVVSLLNGDRIVVEHSEALMFRGGLAVYFGKDNEFFFFDNDGVCEVTDRVPGNGKNAKTSKE